MNKLFSSLFLAAFVVSVLFPAQFARAASAGDLVKCDAFDAVYYLAEDDQRYVFPNERIYLSWYPDFHDVRTISCDDLASIPLGDRVVYQAGTRLVKIPSDPSVYVVEYDGALREIPDESTAIALYGDAWSLRVDDVSEAFWPSFTVGAPLGDDEVPEGTILHDDSGDLFRVDDGGVATEIDVVLTTDQEAVLETHALSVDDIEDRLGIAIALTHVDSAAAIAVLEALIADLRAVDVEDDAIEVEDFDEMESDDDTADDADDAISDAREEIAEAESDIAEDVADGKDVTASTALLITAREHLVLAQAAYDAGDFAGAEEHADSARRDAMEARGKAVEHIDENDDENSGNDDASDDSAGTVETDDDDGVLDDSSDDENEDSDSDSNNNDSESNSSESEDDQNSDIE